VKPVLSALLFLVTSAALAAPPTLELPAEVTPVNGYARLTPKTDAVSVVYVALDKVYPFPSEELKNPRSFVLPVAGLKDGRYTFVAVAAGKGGEQTQGQFAVVVGKPGPTPKPDDPVNPVLPDGPLGLRKVSRDGARAVALPADAAKLAGANRSTASAVAAGGAGSTAASYLARWREGNKGAGVSEAAWAPWATAASGGLQAAYKGGRLTTAGTWAAAFTELADGLDDAGGN
jgi:hypothetical protein